MGRTGWTGDRAAAIALGGALGAGVRWLVVGVAGTDGFPWPVLMVNVVGSFVLGVLLAEEPAHPRARLALHDLGAIGFCGGLTTFSTFALEVTEMLRDGDVTGAAVYGVASVTGSLLAVVAGAATLRRVRALMLPVEGAP